MLGLAVDQLAQARAQLHGRDEHRAVFLLIRVSRQVVEDVRHVADDFRIGGEVAEIGVDLRGLGVVVAGARVHVPLNAVALLADDEA